jgi:hypothetical protein
MGGTGKILRDELTNVSAIQPGSTRIDQRFCRVEISNVALLELEFKIQKLRLFQDREKLLFIWLSHRDSPRVSWSIQ